MTIAGIITEYNPFHNGHAYQLQKVREITGCDGICVVMSGNYCQRGIPAITDKYNRSAMALANGVDLVLELPTYYALSSAEGFARGALEILANAGITHLCFGAECDDLDKLQSIADFLYKLNPDNFTNLIAQGNTYAKALASYMTTNLGEPYSEIMSQPNNILAIEYLKTLKEYPDITPILIKREGNGYNDTKLSIDSYSSATAIRELIRSNTIAELPSTMPNNCIPLINNPIFIDDFTCIFNGIMHSLIWQGFDFTQIDGVNDDFANKLKNNFTGKQKLTEFAMSLKSKDITYARILRCIFKIILGITNKPGQNYLRVLKFNDIGASIIKNAKKQSSLPIATKAADNKELLAQDIHAANIYNSVVYEKYGIELPDDYRIQINKSQ